MKKNPLLLIVAVIFTFLSCTKEDSATAKFEARTKVYTLNPVSDANISGTATFTEKEDGSTTILLSLTNSNNDVHPAHIHLNSAATSGPIAITLASIECNCEESTTEVAMLDSGTAITYDELIAFDGYINVHQSETAMETIIAQGNIGINAH